MTTQACVVLVPCWILWNFIVVLWGSAVTYFLLDSDKVHRRHGMKLKIYESFLPIDEHIMLNTHMDENYDLHHEPLVLDCGMNIGDFPLMLKNWFPDAEIHGFEPFTLLAAIARENIDLNGLDNVRVVNAAVGPAHGWAFMRSRRFCSEVASLLSQDDGYYHHDLITHFAGGQFLTSFIFNLRPFSRLCYMLHAFSIIAISLLLSVQPKLNQTVRVVPLGWYIGKFLGGRRIDLLKLDIEGYAFEALQGLDEPAWSLINNISIELENNRKKDEVRSLLVSHGYTVAERPNPLATQFHAYRKEACKEAK